MLEPQELLQDVIAFFQPKVLSGQSVLVTAGPTFEAIDPVRGITNRSSGKMGFAIARAAQEAGAQVTLVAGPVALPTPRGVRRIDVQSASDMLVACVSAAQSASLFVATAAVADWRPAQPSDQKIKKDGSGQTPSLTFVENPDILATLAQSARALNGALYCVAPGHSRATPSWPWPANWCRKLQDDYRCPTLNQATPCCAREWHRPVFYRIPHPHHEN